MQKSDFPGNYTGLNGRGNYLHRELLYLVEQAEMHPQSAAQLLAVYDADAAVVRSHIVAAASRTVMSGPGTSPYIPALTAVAISPTSASLAVGATRQFTATKSPANATGTPTFATSDPTKATVSATGLVTAVAAGVVDILAALNGKMSKATVTVTA